MEIRAIKSRLSITTVLSHYGLEADKNHRLCCPFHEDKTPSMQVYESTNTVYCFSSNCSLHGKAIDVIDFIMHKENLTKHEAIRKAESLTGSILPASSSPQITINDQARIAVLTKLLQESQESIKKSSRAQGYCKERGLEVKGIGYLEERYHRSWNESLKRSAVGMGLLKEMPNKSLGPVFRHCIIFFMRNKAGHAVSLYGRSITETSTQRHYYLKGSHQGLYPCYPKAETQQLIITESIIDAATLLQVEGIRAKYGVLALYGTNGWTAAHREAVSELAHLKEIIFAFDGDEPGKKATVNYAERLQELLPSVAITTIHLPEGEDLNGLSQSHDEDVFLHLVDQRTPVILPTKEAEQTPSSISFSNEPTEETVTPMEARPAEPVLNTRNPFKISYKTETAVYYIQGGVSKQLDSLKVTLVVENETHYKSRNKLDLYEDKQVEKLCKEVSERLQLRGDLLEGDIYRLTDLLDQYRDNEIRQSQAEKEADIIVPLTDKQRQELEAFGKGPHLIKRLNDLLGKTGIVGEEENRIFLLLVAISHKMDSPSHALIQGSSGSGKTKLLKQVLSCMPREKVTLLTRMTDKALYNYAWNYFHHRLLCFEDMDGLSEEAEFALREFMSSGAIRTSAAVKDEQGNISTGEKYVEGPVATLACTTKGELYEDNMGRVFLIAVDESQEQTKRIIEYQNKKAAGKIDGEEEKRTAQFIERFVRHLRPYAVVNPYADQLHLPQEAHKIRRLNDLFQSFVKIVTLVNQYQRKKDERNRLIAQVEDLETAVEMLFECIVLKVDELDGSLRQFYEKLKGYLHKHYKENLDKVEFSLLEIRQHLHLSKTQLFRYMNDLIELEYVRQCGGHANRGYKYKIVYWDNYRALRSRIKASLEKQLEELRTEHQGTPVERQKSH